MGSLTAVALEVATTWLSALVHGEIGGDGGCCGLACLGLLGGCMLRGWKGSGAWRKLSRGACSGGDIMLLIAIFGCILEDIRETDGPWPAMGSVEFLGALEFCDEAPSNW